MHILNLCICSVQHANKPYLHLRFPKAVFIRYCIKNVNISDSNKYIVKAYRWPSFVELYI